MRGTSDNWDGQLGGQLGEPLGGELGEPGITDAEQWGELR